MALDKNSCKDNFIYHIRHKIPYSINSLPIIFHKLIWSIKNYDGSKYIKLITSEEKSEKI